MVSVAGFKLLHRHAEKAGGMPKIDAALHQPRRASVAQDVRRHVRTEVSGPHRCLKSLAYARDRLAVPLHHSLSSEPQSRPAAHMGEQARRQLHWWLALLGFAAADGAAIEHALLKVDVPAADRRHQRSAADRAERVPV